VFTLKVTGFIVYVDMNILVPPDIVPVKRVSPIKAKTRTVWREKAEGEPIDRGREWLSHDLFVEDSRADQLRGLVSSSFIIHLLAAIVLLILAATQADRVPLVKLSAPLVMPAMLSIIPVVEAAAPLPTPKPRVASAPTPVPQPPAAPPPPAPIEDEAPPLEAPASIAPDPASIASPDGVAGGVDGGVAGGTVGGVVGGTLGGASGGAAKPGPLRVGAGIDPPRKIKDVKPLYPPGALAGRQRGTVVIEATIGADGRVQEATVIHSVPALDHAAVAAVRQWEFLPARMNGAAIAVIITVLVQFAIF
jgi:protein TonB